MIKIELKDSVYDMPESWLDINIKTLQDLTEIKNKEFEFEIDKEIGMLNLLTKIPTELIYDLPMCEFQKLKNATGFINMDFSKKLEKEFSYDGIKYIINLEFESMKTKEFIDLDELQKAGVNKLHLMMAILYKQEGYENEYDISKLKTRAKIFQDNMSAHYALSAMAFMVALAQIFVAKNSKVYSKMEPILMKSQKKMERALKLKLMNNKVML